MIKGSTGDYKSIFTIDMKGSTLALRLLMLTGTLVLTAPALCLSSQAKVIPNSTAVVRTETEVLPEIALDINDIAETAEAISDADILTDCFVVVSSDGESIDEAQTLAKANAIKSQDLRAQIVNYAKQFVGGRYRYGGTSLQSGVDCSGFVINVYKEALQDSRWSLGFDDTTADGLYRDHSRPTEDPQPGDLVFFRGEEGRMVHVAIYLGQGDGELVIIDASSLPETNKVMVRRIAADRSDIAGFAVMELVAK